jgi:hypothetical protein
VGRRRGRQERHGPEGSQEGDFDKSYLSFGFAGYTVETWRRIYFENKLSFGYASVQVAGGVAALWSELNNGQTTLNKLWLRASALAERLWNPAEIDNASKDMKSLVRRLVQQGRRMRARGIKCAPVTVQLCENQPEICFP